MQKILLLANKLVGGLMEGITKALLISPQSQSPWIRRLCPSVCGHSGELCHRGLTKWGINCTAPCPNTTSWQAILRGAVRGRWGEGRSRLEGFLSLVENNVHATLISWEIQGNTWETKGNLIPLFSFSLSCFPSPPSPFLLPSLSSFLNFFFLPSFHPFFYLSSSQVAE